MRSSSQRDLLAHLRAPLYRNAYALILSDLTTSVLGLAYWTLAARSYTPEQVGLNSLAISTMALLSGLFQSTLLGMLLRFIARAGNATAPLIAGVYFVGGLGTVAAGILFFYGLDPISVNVFGESDHTFKLALIAAAAAWCVFSLQDSALAGLRVAGWVSIKNVSYGLAKIGLLAAFATTLPSDFGIFISWVLPAAALLIPGNLYMFGRIIPRHARATAPDATALERGQLVRYAVGDSLGSIFNLMSVALLPLIVTHQAGTAANAFFFLPWTVAQSLHQISYSLGTSLTVEGAADVAGLIRLSRSMLVHMVRLLAPLSIVIVVAAPLILRVFGENYEREGTQLLQFLALAPIPNLVTILVMAVARVQGRTTLIACIRGLLCVLSLGLSLVLIPRIGIVGVGVASLLASTLVAVVVALPLLVSIVRSSGRTNAPVT
ncbi:MAG: rane protein involved in the export of O-antigen and teichoic acid-like protein [Chloroflexi bacterium]|nr:rane protein involved in the export of O-antigen and teichoic acid-like protein [Chloroflexota bacterium]